MNNNLHGILELTRVTIHLLAVLHLSVGATSPQAGNLGTINVRETL